MKTLVYPCRLPKEKVDRNVEFEYSNLEIEDIANLIAK